MYLYDSIKENEHQRKTRWGTLATFKTKKTIHHFRCDNCEKEFTKTKNGKLRESKIHFCSICFNPSLIQKESTKLKLKKAEILGKKINGGYRDVFVGKDYPYRDSHWLREHIVVMERHIQQKIPAGMVVHHIDGDKRNNDLDNLILCTISEHNNCHAKIEQIVFDLYKQGLVKFDKDTKRYYLAV